MTADGPQRVMRRFRFVLDADAIPAAQRDTTVVVLDSAWTPSPTDPPEVRSIRPSFGRAVEQNDLFEEALALLDGWAADAHLADRLIVDGVTYWFRMRETMWRWLHERLLWHHAIADLLGTERPVAVSAPAAEPALIDALDWLGTELSVEPSADTPEPATPARAVTRSFTDRVLGRLGLRPSPSAGRAVELRRREAALAERVSRLAGIGGRRVLVLTTPATWTRIGSGDSGALRDPYFAAVMPGLARAGIETIRFGLGVNHAGDADWPLVEADDRLIPQSLLRTRWSGPDDAAATAAASSAAAALEAARGIPLDLGGVDIAATIVGALAELLARTVETDVRQRARVARLVADLRPDGIVLAQEWIRLPWLLAARGAGIPVFAVQHGVLYPTHPGYPNFRHPALAFPTRTFVYGDYTRRVLTAGAYRDDEVVVSGSPRLDLDADVALPGPEAPTEERESVRREIGVAPSDRLLVVSTVHLEFVRRSHLVHMIERLLGGPLPGVHLVFKQHPGERDDGPYRDLLEGLARAGGYDAPPLSVVRDIDLHRLLRSADAHLGLHSTVLTDAVAAGTPNLIAVVEGHADLLGYVPAGVAHPVASVADVLAALADPPHADAAARRAFLDDHFRPGDASRRIVDAVDESLRRPPVSAA